MITRAELSKHLEQLLLPADFNDYCPNGLQVEGSEQISRIITGVTASQALLDYAVATGADCIIVHHGYFWKGEPSVVSGLKKRRLATLLRNDINLYAYHLPLDYHPELGNNQALFEKLELKNIDRSIEAFSGLVGALPKKMSAAEFNQFLSDKLESEIRHIDTGKDIEFIAICTGAAQDYIDALDSNLIDAFVSGEISERTVHSAIESGIHYFSAGHHATETGGVERLASHLRNEFGIDVEFVDLPIPV